MGSGKGKYNLRLFGIPTGVALAVGGALDHLQHLFLLSFKLLLPHITIEPPGGVLINYLNT